MTRRPFHFLTAQSPLARRRLFGLAAAVSLLVVLLSLDLNYRDGTFLVRLRLHHLPLLLPPLLWVLGHNRRRFDAQQRDERGRAGLCTACGYDLRATPGRCPECGAAPTAAGADA